MNRRAVFLWFALALFLIYAAFTPGAIAGMGYTAEDIRAGGELLARQHIDYPRNGILPVIIDLPFLLMGGATLQDFSLSFEPCLVSALLIAVLFVWCSRITGNRRYAFAIALVAAFATMLWPYAYIGLEPKQSLFLLIAAYLGIEYRSPSSWAATVGFGVAAGLAVASKSTGAFLLPAAVFLVWCYARRIDRSQRMIRIAAACVLVLGLFVFNAWTRSFFWAQYGGSFAFIRPWMVSDAVSPFLNLAAFFGSPNKGLWVYSPVCFLGIFAIPRAWQQHRDVTLFALLTLGGLAGGFSLLTNWSDETWGPRYLHSTICPLLLVLAVGFPKPTRVFRAALALSAVLGFGAALLGVAFYYGALVRAANTTGVNTLENYQGNIQLNHLRFNAALLDEWWHPAHNTWSTAPRWFFEKPADAPAVKSIDLAEYAVPQPILFRPPPIPRPWIWWMLLTALLAGSGLMAWVWVGLAASTESSRHPAAASAPPTPSAGSPG